MKKLIITGFVLVTMFNIKLFAQTNVTTTGGTANYIPKFNGTNTVVNSVIYQDGLIGFIGINNSTPSFGIHLLGNTSEKASITLERRDVNALGGTLFFRSRKSTWGAVGQDITIGSIAFQGPAETSSQYGDGAGIQTITTENWADGSYGAKMLFQTTSNGTSSSTTRMTIDQNGYVGIGTTSPICKLFVAGGTAANDARIIFQRSIAGGWGPTLDLVAINSDAGGNVIGINRNLGYLNFNGEYNGDANFAVGANIIGTTTEQWSTTGHGAKLVFNTTANGTTSYTARLVIDNNGYVGINQTTPGSTLDVKGTFRLSGSTSGYVGFAPAAAAGSTTYTLPSADGTSGQFLQTNGSGTLSWQTPTTSTTAWQLTGNSGTTAGTNFIGTTDVKDLVFKTNNTERMRISTNGIISINNQIIANYLNISENGNFGPIGIGFDILGSESGIIDQSDEKIIAGYYNYGNGKRYIYGGWSINEGITINPTNNFVGIGTSNPDEKLTVVGYGKFASVNGWTGIGHDGANSFLNSSSTLLINYYTGQNVVVGGGGGENPSTGTFESKYNTYLASTNGKATVGSNLPTTIPSKLYVKGDGTTNQTSSFNVVNSNGSSMFIINDDGKVGIGTSNPQNALDVFGTIHSQLIKVDVDNWYDDVFEENYQLMSIESLDNFIKQNKHLPDMPSEKEIMDNGVDVGKINSILTKKVEELTLYIIQQQQQMDELKAKVNELENNKSK